MTIESGTKLGRYEVALLSAAGWMGEVYLALDTELDRTAAIKILPEGLTRSSITCADPRSDEFGWRADWLN